MKTNKTLKRLLALTLPVCVFASLENYRTGGDTLLNLFVSGLGGAAAASIVAAAFAGLRKVIVRDSRFWDGFFTFVIIATLVLGYASFSSAKYKRSLVSTSSFQHTDSLD